MATNTIGTMEVFAGTIKAAMEAYFCEGVRITVQKVTKNNGMVLTGLTIMDKTYAKLRQSLRQLIQG